MNEFVQSPEELVVRDYASAVFGAVKLAKDLMDQEKYRGAKIALCRALTVNPNDPILWRNMSSVLWGLRSYQDALGAAKLSLQMDSNSPGQASAFTNLGNALVSTGDYKQALQAFDQALKMQPDQEAAKLNRSLMLLLTGNYEEGFKDYNIRVDWHQRNLEAEETYQSPTWKGESLSGKTIHIIQDQGLGDTILHSRFLLWDTLLQARKIYFSIHPQLAVLMWDYCKNVPNIEFTYPGAPPPDVDYHVHIGELTKMIVDSPDGIPPDPSFILSTTVSELNRIRSHAKITIPEPKVQPALKVGVIWSGRQDFARNDERMVPFRLLMSLSENPYIWLYSFQVGGPEKEIHDLGASEFIYDLSPEIKHKGWLGTATAMLQMDIIVTCCTSSAHLAGSLGLPTWIMLHTEPYWIWGLESSASKWYPSARLFRQSIQRQGDWTIVVEQVRGELSKLVQQKLDEYKDKPLSFNEGFSLTHA